MIQPALCYGIWDDSLSLYDAKKHRDAIEKLIKEHFDKNPEDKSNRLYIEISSSGGNCDAFFSLIGYIKVLKSRGFTVQTIALGQVSSMAVPFFLLGTERIMDQNSVIFLHRVSATATEKTTDSVVSLEVRRNNLELYQRRYIESIMNALPELNRKTLTKWIENEHWMLPDEAIKYGFTTGLLE